MGIPDKTNGMFDVPFFVTRGRSHLNRCHNDVFRFYRHDFQSFPDVKGFVDPPGRNCCSFARGESPFMLFV
jgi:hypothetical protein